MGSCHGRKTRQNLAVPSACQRSERVQWMEALRWSSAAPRKKLWQAEFQDQIIRGNCLTIIPAASVGPSSAKIPRRLFVIWSCSGSGSGNADGSLDLGAAPSPGSKRRSTTVILETKRKHESGADPVGTPGRSSGGSSYGSGIVSGLAPVAFAQPQPLIASGDVSRDWI